MKRLHNPRAGFAALTRRVLWGEDRIIITRGGREHLDALAHLHTRAGRPGVVVRILIARERGSRELAGVLCVSMPVLNGPWRAHAWPDMPVLRRDAAAWLNANVRTISRVIVAGPFRGLGVARRLVAAYLENPLTPRTEALAAMGAFCPFFEQAGMTPTPCPPAARDRRLAAVLRLAGIEPWRLVDASVAARLLRNDPCLRAAVLRWANDAGSTRRLLVRGEPLEELAGIAASHVTARPVAYTHRRG